MTNALFDLSNKTIIVTGATGHLGVAMCEGLASMGANIAVASRDLNKVNNLVQKLSEKYGGNHQGYQLDISDAESVKKAISEIIKTYKIVDVLINNANFYSMGEVEEYSDDEWVKGIDGTINAVHRCTKAVLPHMLENGQGNIINIGSMYGVVSPNPEVYGSSGQNNPANYGAGKAAIIQFTKYLACHYGTRGIRANSVSPGPFPNPKVQENDEFIKQLSRKTALGRIGQADELKGILVMLASDASSYITGQNICVDGGWTAW
ncbi:SDR family oxidoreductase [Paenibacillus lutimineralis]|uniref:SDR family oxidoreductase n=1 Tax=Paenibacillus lutimineralis TaxID=2707005 RepID=A0A3Q9ICH7_9BACL|nr:SDR family oxidoreductase [Paenibacillus lutimineralis]AZS17578.1 SDR family oxidoreductase [Paenibacillus lutimineralis]